MAVTQRRPTPPDSPPKAKRMKKKEIKQITCIEPKKTLSGKSKKAIVSSLCDNWTSTMERAEEVQSNLASKLPSFVKKMLPSHVGGGFWLGLPKKFCDLNMLKHDAMIVLEDEDGSVFETKYLGAKAGLSGGWRGFSIAHELVEGDVLVFQLVTPCKFKVYIIRSNGSDEVDCALGLLKLEARNNRVDTMDMAASDVETEILKALIEGKSDDDDDKENENRKNSIGTSDHSDKHSIEMSPEVPDGIRLSDAVVAFEQVRSFNDFEILVNGLVINSEFSNYLCSKYYELCCSQKAFLHENLLEGLNCKLIAGVILETIKIADAIKGSKISSYVDAFSIWDKTLLAFQGLGMNVGFLLARLDKLVNLAVQSEKYQTVRAKCVSARDELRILEAKILAAKEKVSRLDAEFETLQTDHDKLEIKFKEAATAAW